MTVTPAEQVSGHIATAEDEITAAKSSLPVDYKADEVRGLLEAAAIVVRRARMQVKQLARDWDG